MHVPNLILPEKSWLEHYVDYTAHTETPKQLHLLSGLSAIASVLKRQVWLDMRTFKWYPSLYIVIVAKPGIVAKSTTLTIARNLVRDVEGVHIGADAATWQALSQAIAGCGEFFTWGEEQVPEAAMSFFSSEYGSLMDLQNQEMVNFFIDMWDGKDVYNKLTKTSGEDMIEGPIINLIAATTPAWIQLNMNVIASAGGLTSRTLFAYAEGKERFIAYPDAAPTIQLDLQEDRRAWLVNKLSEFSTLRGPLTLDPGARKWGENWYVDLWSKKAPLNDTPWYEGYIARAQTQLHKLAICFAISSSRMTILKEDLQLADILLSDLSKNLFRVFASINKSPQSLASDKLLEYVRIHNGCSYQKAIAFIRSDLPDFRNFEAIVKTLIQSNQIKLVQNGTELTLQPVS